MTEQEAQQAQTIAEIRQRAEKYTDYVRGYPSIVAVEHKDRISLLEIVDSQAQKIAEQAKEIERLKSELQLAVEVITYDPMIVEELK